MNSTHPRRPLRARVVAPIALLALVAGVLTARADAADDTAKPRAVAVAKQRANGGMGGRAVPIACPPISTPAGAKPAPPSQDLLNAFAVLRRERQATDELPAHALKALTVQGLAPVDPASARLLRTTATGGKAWIVPVPDVGVASRSPFWCMSRAVRLMKPGARPKAPRAAKPTPTVTTPKPAEPAPSTKPRKPGAPAPAIAVPKPQEGVVVVSIGDAAAGAGGSLADLVRGRAPVEVDACAGPNHDMLGVSGVVPDGVSAAFLTAPDGTAVKADVVDNAYAFVVPSTKGPEPRYVVWTGGDGTPHVQPVAAGFTRLPSGLCKRRAAAGPRVSAGNGACAGNVIAMAPLTITKDGRRRPPSRVLWRASPMACGVVVAPVPRVIAPSRLPKPR